ncbi:hypothetical protein [Geodermatophilus sp. SYSU D01119]
MRRFPALLVAAALLTGCGGSVAADASGGTPGPAPVSLADVAGADAGVLGVAALPDGRAVVLLAPPGGPLTLADVAADGTATAVPVPGLDAERPGLTRIAATGDGVVVVGTAAGRIALVAVGPHGAGGVQPVGTIGAADVAAVHVAGGPDSLHLALGGITGSARVVAVDPATGAVRGTATLPGTPRDLQPTGDGGAVVATEDGPAAAVTTLDAAAAVVGTAPLGNGSTGPLTVVDGEVYAITGSRGELRITRGAEVLTTVDGDLPAAIAVDPDAGTATLVDTVSDAEVPRVLERTVDLASEEVTGEVELCDSGAVTGTDLRGGAVVADCRGEPTLWRLG